MEDSAGHMYIHSYYVAMEDSARHALILAANLLFIVAE